MKKWIPLILVILISVLSVCLALADAPAPVLPEGDLQVMDVKLKSNQVWEVYTGPGLDYSVASRGAFFLPIIIWG